MGVLPVCCMPRSASTTCFLRASNSSGVVLTGTLGPTRRVQVFERILANYKAHVKKRVTRRTSTEPIAPCLFSFKPRQVDAQLRHPITRRVLDQPYLLLVFVQDLNVDAKALQFFHQHFE